jgi:hypothetical protein
LWHHDHGDAINGYWLTPIRPGEKAAYQLNWSKKPLKTREAVERHWQANPNDNIGLVPRPDHFWLDADDLDVLESAEAKHGRLPPTYSQRSLNGNLHFLFQGEATTSPALHFDGKKLGEIRGALSGQCVAAGSQGTTKDGKPGAWQIEELASPIAAPDWLLGLIKRGGKATARDARADYGEPIQWDTEQAARLVEAAMRGKLFKTYEGPFIEGERDNLTFQLFAEAKGRMIHPDTMLEATLFSGIDGGLGDEVVERKMQSAYHDGNTQDVYGKKVSAYWFPNHVFKAYVDGKPVDRLPADPVAWKAMHCSSLPKAFRSDPEPMPDATIALPYGAGQAFYYLDMLDTIPEPTWTIDTILPEGGYTLVYGKRSTRKSFAALDMGLSVATGIPFHGRDVKRGRVVYLAGEGFRGSKRRVAAWFMARKLDSKDHSRDFALVPFTPKWDTTRGREVVRKVLSEITKDGSIALVIIDTARRAMSGDENAPTSVGQFLDGVSEVCREFGCAHMILHHAGKDESKGARGGGPFEDDADAVLRFTKGTGDTTRMTCTKQKDAEADWTMIFRADISSLGTEPSGKPITSLTLMLESESKTESDERSPAQSDREQYAAHDALAVQIMDGLRDPFARRGDLALAVTRGMTGTVREDDPQAFKKMLRAYGAHLTRLSQRHALWRYIDQKNGKGEALTFHNPNQRGRRVRAPGRGGLLNFTLANKIKED